MSEKHTPGPWKVRKAWNGDGKEVYPVRKVTFGQPCEVAVVCGIYDECTANARLFAASPVMASLLIQLNENIERLGHGHYSLESRDGFDAQLFIDKLRAVLSAATGENRHE